MQLSIRRRLLLAFLGLAVVPLLATTFANVGFYAREYAGTELEHLRELSLRVAGQVGATLHRGEQALKNLRYYRDLWRLSAAEQERLLAELVARHNFFREVALIDDRGRERVRSSSSELVLADALRDLSAEERFIRPRASGGIYYGPVHYDAGGEPLMALSMPMAEPYYGEVEAVLSAQLRLRPLWELIAKLQLSDALQVYVVDETGAVVAHRNPSVVLRGTRVELPVGDGVARGLGGSESFVASSTVRLGQRRLWVVAEHERWHALRPALVNLLVAAGILIVALLLAFGAGSYALRRIVRPIEGIAGTARAIAAGDLDQRVAIEGDDEIGDLTRSFNAMTDHLQEALVTLTEEMGERKQAEEALRESEARYRLMVENQNDLVVKIDPRDGRLLFISPSYCRVFGKTQEELLGNPFLPLVHEEDRAHVLASLRRLLEPPYTTQHEERVLTVDGWRWLAWSNRAVRDGPGEVVEAIAVGRDVTERKESEMQLAQYRERLEELVAQRTRDLERTNAELRQSEEGLRRTNKELEAFSYSVSHDLRAPLRGIDGFSKVLLDKYADQLEPQALNYLERVRGASQRMGELIDDLLGLSRIQRQPLNREAVDLSGLAEQVVNELRTADPRRRVEIAIEPGLSAHCDRRLARVVLDNLLGNAWKYTVHSESPRIELAATEVEGVAGFVVRDNGAGFDMRYADKLFAPFQRLHRESEFQGTGIGLATVQRAIQHHLGRVTAEGEPGRGAAFHFHFGGQTADDSTIRGQQNDG